MRKMGLLAMAIGQRRGLEPRTENASRLRCGRLLLTESRPLLFLGTDHPISACLISAFSYPSSTAFRRSLSPVFFSEDVYMF